MIICPSDHAMEILEMSTLDIGLLTNKITLTGLFMKPCKIVYRQNIMDLRIRKKSLT